MNERGGETALVVLVPEAEPAVSSFRATYDPSARQGMPAHITILYPFASDDSSSDHVGRALERLFQVHPTFAFSLQRTCRFPGVLYLAPEPREPFDELIARVRAEFPGFPPYRGTISHPIPHLTIADPGHLVDLDSIETEFIRRASDMLPIAATVRTVAWMAVDGIERLQMGGTS
jgi:2'-5' RNA ligase